MLFNICNRVLTDNVVYYSPLRFANKTKVVVVQIRRKWDWRGHTLRQDKSIAKQPLKWTTNGQIEIVRPKHIINPEKEMDAVGFRYNNYWKIGDSSPK